MELTDGFTTNIVETAKALHGVQRRLFMARTVDSLGSGGQWQAEADFGWSRPTIRKGMHETDGAVCEAKCVAGAVGVLPAVPQQV